MLQLQLLDLGIRKDDVAVPIDITVRTDPIDLMARILVVVFQAEEGRLHD